MGALACLNLYGYRVLPLAIATKAKWMALLFFSAIGGICCFVRIPKRDHVCETVSAEALAQRDMADRFARAGGYVLLGAFGAVIGFGMGYFPLYEKHPLWAILVGLLVAVIGALVVMFGGNEFPFHLIKRPIQSVGNFLGYLVGLVYVLLIRKK